MGNVPKKGAPGVGQRAIAEVHLAQARERLAMNGGDLLLHQRYHSGQGKLEKDYVLGNEVLGYGVNGKVRLARSRNIGQRYAVKTIDLKRLEKSAAVEGNPDLPMSIAWEMEIMMAVDHPHIVRLVDVYETGSSLHLVMECMEGGELFDRLQQRKRFTENDAAEALQQMLGVISYLHSRGIIHRDLKPENFLYEAEGGLHLKLTDFGFSRHWDSRAPLTDQGGTLSYTAPEVLAKSHTTQCDVWSLGVIAFMLIGGYSPFEGAETQKRQNVSLGRYRWRGSYWSTVSSDAIDFVQSLLTVDPVQRPTANSALGHSWLTQRKKASIVDIPHPCIVKGIRQYQKASRFRRACLTTMARSMTLEDVASVRSYFMSCDTLHNGSCCVKTLRETMAATSSLSEDEIYALFQDMDEQLSISYSEFLAAMVLSFVQPRHALLVDAFHRFDVDSRTCKSKPESGFILQGGLQKAFSVDKMEAQKLLLEADYNQSGKVSFEDFSRLVIEGLPSTSPKRKLAIPNGSNLAAIFSQRCKNMLLAPLWRFACSHLATSHLMYANLLGGWPITSSRITA